MSRRSKRWPARRKASTSDIDWREAQENEIGRLRQHMDAARITEADVEFVRILHQRQLPDRHALLGGLNHRISFLAAPGAPELGQIAKCAVNAPLRWRMRVSSDLLTE